MRDTIRKITLLLLLCLVASGTSCIMEEKVIEIVLTDKTCADFEQDEDSATFVTPAVLDYGSEIEEILEENDVSRSDIKRALVVSGSYGVTDFSHTHDWVIGGYISVERLDISDGPATIVNYSSQSVQAALGIMIPADLNGAGVALLNRALADFIAGSNPILRFEVHNGSVGPTPPDAQDRMIFDWKGCIVIHVVVSQELDVPDPF